MGKNPAPDCQRGAALVGCGCFGQVRVEGQEDLKAFQKSSAIDIPELSVLSESVRN